MGSFEFESHSKPTPEASAGCNKTLEVLTSTLNKSKMTVSKKKKRKAYICTSTSSRSHFSYFIKVCRLLCCLVFKSFPRRCSIKLLGRKNLSFFERSRLVFKKVREKGA